MLNDMDTIFVHIVQFHINIKETRFRIYLERFKKKFRIGNIRNNYNMIRNNNYYKYTIKINNKLITNIIINNIKILNRKNNKRIEKISKKFNRLWLNTQLGKRNIVR
jgi:hypothetical protein